MSPNTYQMRQRGFSIVELMVGIVMALLATYAIMGSYKAYEGRKRTTASSEEANMNAMFAVTQLDREFGSAGYGFQTGRGGVGCNFTGQWTVGASSNVLPTIAAADAPNATNLTTGFTVTRLFPALIVDGGTGPDGLRIMYGNSVSSLAIFGSTITPTIFAPSNNSFGVNVGDMALLQQSPGIGADATSCQIAQVTGVNVGLNQVTFAPGPSSGVCLPLGYGCASGSSFNSAALMTAPTSIVNLGAFTVNSYYISKGNLIQNSAILGNVYSPQGVQVTGSPVVNSTLGSSLKTSLGANIVNFKAQYGLDTTRDGVANVNTWVTPTGTYAANVMTAVEAEQIRAVRYAIVMRSPLPENKQSAGQCTATTVQLAPFTWADGTNASIDVAPGAVDQSWRCYRYQIVTGVVPLRNMLWSTASYEL
jgi:type IV pilus assembly protein PilW